MNAAMPMAGKSTVFQVTFGLTEPIKHALLMTAKDSAAELYILPKSASKEQYTEALRV